MTYSGQLIVDADMTATGWEVVVRFDAESMEFSSCDLTDEDLDDLIGTGMAAAFIADRDREQGGTK